MRERSKNVTGRNVRKLRISKGLSQEAFAARLQICGWDLSRAGLSKIEAGLRLVIDAEVLILSNALKCQPVELFRDVEKMEAITISRHGRH